jgi:hypothetical protein
MCRQSWTMAVQGKIRGELNWQPANGIGFPEFRTRIGLSYSPSLLPLPKLLMFAAKVHKEDF